jgi:GrpB-like predicted nucleotidyltransferase (UPF0157 family)
VSEKTVNHLPLTEEQIRAKTVGELAPFSEKVLIVDYDPAWPDLFKCEAKRLRNALGPRALEIEHIGSTSVPSLAAKPIIDMLLVVKNSAERMHTCLIWRAWVMSFGSVNGTGMSTGC